VRVKSSLVVSVLGLLASLLVLTGCVSSGGGNAGLVNKYSTACMFEVNPPGSYVWTDRDSMVKPGGGGTAEGAAALNACIQKKAAAAGETVVTAQAAQSRQVVEVEQSGGQVVETFTYGSPPTAATSPAPARRSEERCRARNVLSGGAGYNGCVK
jgi:hypothetical protein